MSLERNIISSNLVAASFSLDSSAVVNTAVGEGKMDFKKLTLFCRKKKKKEVRKKIKKIDQDIWKH